MRTAIYIDTNNIHKGFTKRCIDIDYEKFRIWLSQKYNTEQVRAFIGYIEENKNIYNLLTDYGYKITHKVTRKVKNKYKGNCDAEIVLKIVSDYYEKDYDRYVIGSSDGDFGCVVSFLMEKGAKVAILTTSIDECSILLKKESVSIIDLDQHYHKFSKMKKPAIKDAS